jgi:precorrin-8X/cobalt-precorrin-8 methylmutase
MKDPGSIESRSMEIIETQLPELARLQAGEKEIVKRVVHTTGDVTIAGLMRIHPGAVEAGLAAIRAGKTVITDINMLKAGINAKRLALFGAAARCYIGDEDVAEEARRLGQTRAMVAMRKAAPELNGGIVAIGNAPTALFALVELIDRGEVAPALIVGTPVGFVGASESKEMLTQKEVPYITIPGTRGGSAIAAAVVNALLYMA